MDTIPKASRVRKVHLCKLSLVFKAKFLVLESFGEVDAVNSDPFASRGGWILAHLSGRTAHWPLIHGKKHQMLNTFCRWVIGLRGLLQAIQNSVLPLLNRARKSSASIKIPAFTAKETISPGVVAP